MRENERKKKTIVLWGGQVACVKMTQEKNERKKSRRRRNKTEYGMHRKIMIIIIYISRKISQNREK